MNISLDRTDQLKELNDSDFSVMPIPNIQPSAPISEPFVFLGPTTFGTMWKYKGLDAVFDVITNVNSLA